MKKFIMTLGVIAMSLTVAQAQYDDIYYNPKNDKSDSRTVKQKTQKKSNYIADFSNMDVDAYNRVGDTYYTTPVDTIGTRVGEDQDFVYTQQIQKYYNPTIVVDNANLLQDVLNNSYGNVEVVINNNGVPVFSPYYSSIYYDYPFYSNRIWGPSWSWSWGPSWTWGPSWNWAWGWGPSWAWGPSWNWGWGPGWGPSPGWGPGPGWGGGWNRPFYADYRPGAHRPVAPRPGWSNNRPGGNYNGNHQASRPGRAPSSGGVSTGSTPNRQYAGNRRGYNDASATLGTVRNRAAASSNRTYQTQNGHRVTTGGTTNSSTSNHRYSTQTQRTQTMQGTTGSGNNRSYGGSHRTTNNNSYNHTTNSNSYNRGSYNSTSGSHRSSGGSYGGGSRSGGGSGGGGSRAGGGHRR